jgi:hypothetical protein
MNVRISWKEGQLLDVSAMPHEVAKTFTIWSKTAGFSKLDGSRTIEATVKLTTALVF